MPMYHSDIDDVVKQAKAALGQRTTSSSSGPPRASDKDAWLDELAYLTDRVKAQSDPKVRESFEHRIEELLTALGGGQSAAPSRLGERIHKQAQQARDKAKLPAPPKKPQLSPQDKKVLAALKVAAKPDRKFISPSKFNLPQFTTDNATAIVLASILIVFFLELHAGTKFVTLWNDAFSPGTSTSSNTTTTSTANQDHTGLESISTTATTSEQDTSGLTSSFVPLTGSGPMLQYGVPDTYHYLEAAIW